MKKKFRRKTEQTNPTNPSGDLNALRNTNDFDIDSKTIKEQQTKR